jgi:hypothetical protein
VSPRKKRAAAHDHLHGDPRSQITARVSNGRVKVLGIQIVMAIAETIEIEMTTEHFSLDAMEAEEMIAKEIGMMIEDTVADGAVEPTTDLAVAEDETVVIDEKATGVTIDPAVDPSRARGAISRQHDLRQYQHL